ncbi:hypothetical protein QWY22_09815 [Planococcus liqunii]|uniref:hypothetical protein n=1 Tax=Planococcus liqunii TaxID=3058394 RepID=UPI0026391442|nr:hypothetical protein [Planococcus sp. N056]WKA52948.1 hypothetical protein QWY22_09815 [Planococcus sp. N056]
MESTQKFIINIENQEWLYDNEEEDLCSHGEIHLSVNRTIITQSGIKEEWGISESALALLRTIDNDYVCHPNDKEGLILHGCGAILMMGCPISIHWTVEHSGDQVLLSDFVKIITTDPETGSVYYPGLHAALNKNEYKKQIVQFAVQVKNFFDASKEKRITDDYDRETYQEFWDEFNQLLENNLLDPIGEL